jgi:hypothetical protein
MRWANFSFMSNIKYAVLGLEYYSINKMIWKTQSALFFFILTIQAKLPHCFNLVNVSVVNKYFEWSNRE